MPFFVVSALVGLVLCLLVVRDARDVDFSCGPLITSSKGWIVLVAIFGVVALPGYAIARRRALRSSSRAATSPVGPAVEPNAATSVAPPGWG